MNKKALIILLTLSIVVNLTMNLLDRQTAKKIAYVRSHDLVYAYDGMKAMQLKFQDQSKAWEANLDTLKMEYHRSLSQYQEVIHQLNNQEKATRENLLRIQQNNVIQYSENIQLKSKEEEEKMLKGVLNQVNSFVEEYGKSNNYDIILGTTLSGSILYGRETIDITEELLQELNKQYRGQ